MKTKRRAPEPNLPLTGEAREFWNRHYWRLKRARVLTKADPDSFALLCLVWGQLYALSGIQPGADAFREMIQFTNLTKQYQALAKQFGLLPRERKAAKMEVEAPAKKDEFGL